MAYPILAPNSTWYKSSTARSTITQINIVDSYTPTGSENESWNADASNSGSIKCYRTGTVVTIAGNGSGKIAMNADSSYLFSIGSGSDFFKNVGTISGADKLDATNVTNMSNMFDRATSLQNIDVSNWNTSKVTSMRKMFQACISLESLNLSNWNVGSVTTMEGMFMSVKSIGAMQLTSIGDVSNWDVSKVTTMQGMFQNCTELVVLDLSGWDTSSCCSFKWMFNGDSSDYPMKLTSIGDVSNWDVSKVTTMYCMFQHCVALTTLKVSGWVTSSCTDMEYMFNECHALTTLDISNWDVSKVTSMHAMFKGCSSLIELNVSNWDVKNTTKMGNMFYKCYALTTLDVSNWNTSSCADMSAMFYQCFALIYLDVSNWDVSKVTTMNHMFSGSDYGQTRVSPTALDVSKWKPSSCTDMSFMFYGCTPKTNTIDVSGWDVSKVTTFDHMFAHGHVKIGDISNWRVSSACKNLNAIFLSVQNTTLDVSGFDTSNVTVFDQMFQGCTQVTEIIGLENFNTSKGFGFSEMFQDCYKLKKLDLSSFDTTKAKDGAEASTNGSYTTTMSLMFSGTRSLEKIILGDKFSFKGDGTTTNTSNHAVLPTPSATYITGADGNWYDAEGNAYAPSAVPNGAGTYYAAARLIYGDKFTAVDLPILKIHQFKNTQQYEKAKANGYVGDTDLILVPDDNAGSNTDSDLPTVTSADAGKFLRVSVDGKWVAETLRNAEEVSY